MYKSGHKLLKGKNTNNLSITTNNIVDFDIQYLILLLTLHVIASDKR